MLRHLSINTEKTYTHWLGRYGVFLKHHLDLKQTTTERKMEAFLTTGQDRHVRFHPEPGL